MSVDIWLKRNKKPNLPVKIQLSENFQDPVTGQTAFWTLTPLTAGQAEEIQEKCWINYTDPATGQPTRNLDAMKYINGLAARTVTEPDLLNKEIQEAYGTVGSAVNTLNEMLSPAEKNRLIEEINRMYNINSNADRNQINDVKNA